MKKNRTQVLRNNFSKILEEKKQFNLNKGMPKRYKNHKVKKKIPKFTHCNLGTVCS